MNKATYLFITKTLRVFGYSYISILLPIYLLSLHYSQLFVGMVITVSIFGSVIYNILVSKYADKFGRGKSLTLFAVLMAISGILFALNINSYSIILAAIIGTISATGTEAGPFLSIEQAALTKFTTTEKRTITYSTYNFLGYVAMGAGSLFSGVPGYFNDIHLYTVLFYLYSVIAFIMALIYFKLGTALELYTEHAPKITISPEARKIIIKLSTLFSMDALGGGFVVQSILALWFYSRWHIHLGNLALLFFGAAIITSISLFVAAFIARHIGLLNTMVFTHIPSSLFLITIPFAPSAFGAIALLFARQSLSQMDVPTRQSYMMAIVHPEERTATTALTNISRNVAQGITPVISSYMIQLLSYSVPFVAGGSIKIVYDILIFLSFRKIKPPEEIK